MKKKMNLSKELQEYLPLVGVSKVWWGKTLSNFKNDKAARDSMLKFDKNWKESLEEGVGAFLYGPPGAGKSHLMNCFMINRLSPKKQATVKVVKFSNIISKFTSTWYDKKEYAEFYEVLRKVKFFGIESLGREFSKTESELPVKVFETVLDIRLSNKLPLFITSTLTPKEISDVYSEDCASMLREITKPIRVNGSDFRHNIIKAKTKLL
jgi:DNA replication protein DnaC